MASSGGDFRPRPKRPPPPPPPPRSDEGDYEERRPTDQNLSGSSGNSNSSSSAVGVGREKSEHIELAGLPAFVNDPLFSDLTFIVGINPENQKKYYGHKVVLASKSPVFLAMFTSDIPLQANAVHIEDTEPEVFEVLLKYIYENQCGSRPRSDSDFLSFSFETLVQLTYLATKYLIQDLMNRSTSIIVMMLKQHLRVKTAFRYWKVLLTYLPGSSALEATESFIDINAENLIQNPHSDFMNLDEELLVKFLERSSLHIKRETDIFRAVIRWAHKRAQNTEPIARVALLHEIIGPALYQIRFLTMDFYVFNSVVCPEGILTQEEVQEITACMSSLVQNKIKRACRFPFNDTARWFTEDTIWRAVGINGSGGQNRKPEKTKPKVTVPTKHSADHRATLPKCEPKGNSFMNTLFRNSGGKKKD